MSQLSGVPPSPSVPPQNLEAEESVLGAMMIAPGAVEAVSEILDGSDFYRESHAKVYRAALALYERGEPVDAITLTNILDQRSELEDVGGRVRLHELAALVPASANAAHYARIVREGAILRGFIRAGGSISRLGWDRPGEINDLIEQAEQELYEVTQQRARGTLIPAADMVGEAYRRIVALSESGEDVVGVSTGFEAIDRLTSGLQPGNLIIVAARPSMGKSGLALNIGGNVAIRAQLPTALFTLEMSRSEVMQRYLSAESYVDSQKIRNGRNLGMEDWQRLSAAALKIEAAPLFIDDSSLSTVGEIRSKARRLKMRHPDLALIIVDYLQLMASGGNEESRVQEVSRISRGLKILAGDLEVPIIALSQLSRAVETRHDKRPILSDLRDSGSIEQDADIVMFIYRDEYYNPEDTDQEGIAEVQIAKQRNGPTGTVKLAFVKKLAGFDDLQPVPST
jgi:replicative DNA helicase